MRPAVAEAPPETTRIKLAHIAGICIARQYVAEKQLRLEGFTDVQYIDLVTATQALAVGAVDVSMAFVAPFIVQVDAEAPIVLLGGVNTGCYELFGTDRIRTIRDLKGLQSALQLFVGSMATYVGLDPARDINFVVYSGAESMQRLADGKIDALMAFPPFPQELRARGIGHVIMSTGSDRPWSQYFCRTFAANREFARRYPIATKRALRAILKATDFCAAAPERAARLVSERGYSYEYSLQTMREISYARWREYDPEDAVRFYALRLHEAGIIRSNPKKIIAQGTDWHFFNEIKRELKG
jgi:NitT/TauT family transport system substrate-binding protein